MLPDADRDGAGLTEERKLAGVLDEHPFATLAYNADLRCVDLNRASEELFGLSRADLLGIHLGALVHPEDAEMAASGIAVQVANTDPGRAWPAIVRIVNSRGEAVPIGVSLRVLSPAIAGVSYVLSMYRAGHTYAMDRLVDSLYAANEAVSLDLAVAAVEATGHYCASIHHTHGFSGLGRFDSIVHSDIGKFVDLNATVLERVVRDAATGSVERFLPLRALGLPDEIEHGGRHLRSAVIFPLEVLGVVAGGLVVWTEQPSELGLFGRAYVERVAWLTGVAFSQEIERKARSSTREVGELLIDLVERTVAVNGRVVKLTPIEATIIGLLSERPGRPVSREQILQRLFGSTHMGESRAADVQIKNLRQKLGDDPFTQRLIVTLRGVGYALRAS